MERDLVRFYTWIVENPGTAGLLVLGYFVLSTALVIPAAMASSIFSRMHDKQQ